jgi:hypothetical protein
LTWYGAVASKAVVINTSDPNKLSVAEKDALILELAAKISQLERLIDDLRAENARLKGVKAN